MAAVIATYGFHFAQPWWLAAALLAVPAVWLAWKSLAPLERARQVLACTLRVVVICLLAALLARPSLERKHDQLTLIAVVDRSQSVPESLQKQAMGFLGEALAEKRPTDQVAVVDVGEAPWIARLPGKSPEVPERNTALLGLESDLAGGVQMAMAIAPPTTATRILLVTDGNETTGDLREAVRIASANGIPVDILPLRYNYKQEVVFRRLAVPSRARSGQTVDLRFVLDSTTAVSGRLELSVNGRQQDLDPETAGVGAPVTLKPGTNVKTVSLPVGVRGVHEFEATFVPDDPRMDRLTHNNRAGGVTFVAGPGRVLVVDGDGVSAAPLVQALGAARIDVQHVLAPDFPQALTSLLDVDAVVLVNTGITFGEDSGFTYRQQEMLCRYVEELGGGLVMVGGPESFGAGGWIGSPVAKILPVDLDPPQKKQMPKGALVLIMHACEMPQGNHWGKTVAIAAVKALSRLDMVGVLDFGWNQGDSHWVYPLSPAGDKRAVIAAIKRMEMGDMPDFGAPMQAALTKLQAAQAGQKHVIIISDGDPSMPSAKLLADYKKAGVTCSGVAVFPHDASDVASLSRIANVTGGRFYNVKNPNKLPQIFIKEARVVRRALIIEEPFTPQIVSSLGEIVRGIGSALPKLEGLVLTGPKGGANQVLLTDEQGSPVLATGQAGMGRTVAFTSSADGRWAGQWLAWGGYRRFWEQTVRWAARPGQSPDCELFTDVRGRSVTVTVDAVDAEGKFVQMSSIVGQVIAPDMTAREMTLRQAGPGRYHAEFQADQPGSFLVNLHYRKAGGDEVGMAQTVVMVPYAPEFRDLSDNAPLLAEIAAATGGRIIQGEPGEMDLFDRSGAVLPATPLPLTGPLMIAWVILFLLDVAARRIAVDVRALLRKAAVALRPRRRAAQKGKTLDRLQARREKLKQQLAARAPDATAQRKYQARAESAEPLRMADVSEPAHDERTPAQAAAPDAEAPPTDKPQTETHLDRLLRAKRKARGQSGHEDDST